MKQYIKKALWIIPFVFSLNLSATVYLYQGGGASNTSNWKTSGTRPKSPSDFTTPLDIFDVNGQGSVSLDGMTIGEVTFQNSSSTASSVTLSSGATLTISGASAPVFTTGTNFSTNFGSQGKIIYNFTNTSTPNTNQFIAPLTYYDIEFSGNPKTFNTTCVINNTLTEISGVKISISNIITLGSNFTFSVASNTTFEISSNGDVIDNRSNKDFPKKWTISKGNTIYYLPTGTFEKLHLNSTQYSGVVLTGNTTITTELAGITADQFIDITDLGTNTYRTLTLKCTAVNNPVYITGDPTANLIVDNASYSLYMDPLQSSTLYLHDLTVKNGANLTLQTELNITGGASYGTVAVQSSSTLNTSNYLTLKANANGSARIGESVGVISGEYTAETYIPATGRKYRFLASPVVGGTALEWRDNGGSTASRGLQITGNNGSTNGFDVSTTNNPSAFYYNEANAGSDTAISAGIDDAGWTAFLYGDGRTSLENGKGYRVLVRGDRRISLTANPAPTANATTIWVKGTYPGYSASSSSSQSIVINLSYTSSAGINKGINLVGNPYPSTIDWNAVTKGANVDAGYITYDPGVTGKGWTAASRYRAYNGSTGGAGRYISAGQGFLVYTSSNTGNSITFEENDKVTNAGGGFFAEKLTNHLIVSFIYDSVYYDEAYLHFREDARDIRDRYDVVQFINPTVNVATIDSTGNSYNINSLGKLENKRSVFVNIANNPILDYKIKFNDLGTFANHRIFLKDNFKKETIEIFEGNEYPISITADPMSNAKNRIELVFEPISASLKRISDNNIISLETNPVIEKLVLKNNEATEIGTAQINIINTTGQLIDTKKWETSNNDSFEYQTQKLSTGIYFIEIASKNYSQTIKFTKQ